MLLNPGEPFPTESWLLNSCVQARRKCQANPTCKAAYQHLGSCASGLNTPMPSGKPAAREDCLEAAQQLRNSSLMGCSCPRRMKNQAACLNIYWTVHPARSLGDYELDVSPYEDTVTSKPWRMNLSELNILKPDSNTCLKFAMLCLLNDKCDRLRNAYGVACSGSHCQRQVCLQQLRAFFEKAEQPLVQGLLLCPCLPADRDCGERRRNTIGPSCALPSPAPNCLDLQRLCVGDLLCRSRLADFQTHCHPRGILGTCATEQFRCLHAYLGMIGTAMTPNFVSNVNTSVALSCTCRGSGNLQEECEQLQRSFSSNACLEGAIAAKMRVHKQLFFPDLVAPVPPVMEHQNKNSDLRPQPWVPFLFSCTLPLILCCSLW
ncbi:GDNF family receptor alpha-3 isoform X2 [Fukomys damarensis]|uniref:GDNF family receptor alpha-3 isoform X2 n=1 Tax=Fukomys damarensis TaxID=885580 RepID=UPI001455605E|nr:GDNF family receptor alpha-3 isoform X2 [Fukomys damarensis]